MTPKVTALPSESIQHAQNSTNSWGGLAIATGAAMKPKKCFAYFMTYPVIRGCHTLGTIEDLPEPTASIQQADDHPLPPHMTVPLPDGTNAPIPTLPPTTASLMHGVWFGPASRGTKHIQEMCKKGFNWAERLSSRLLPHADAWTSFTLQLYPGMVWGIATIVLSPLQQNQCITNASHFLGFNAILNYHGEHCQNVSRELDCQTSHSYLFPQNSSCFSVFGGLGMLPPCPSGWDTSLLLWISECMGMRLH